MKHCNDCHKDGQPLVNNRGQSRCRFCYSLRLESIPEPVVIEQDFPARYVYIADGFTASEQLDDMTAITSEHIAIPTITDAKPRKKAKAK